MNKNTKYKLLGILIGVIVCSGLVYLATDYVHAGQCVGTHCDMSVVPATECTTDQECCTDANCGTGKRAVWDTMTGSCICYDTGTTPTPTPGTTTTPTTSPSTGSTTVVTIGPPFTGGPTTISEVIANVTSWILGIAGAIAVLFIIICGVRYITSAGDTKQQEAAKKCLTNAIVGLVIIVTAFFIVRVIVDVLS